MSVDASWVFGEFRPKVGHGDLLLNISGIYRLKIIKLGQQMHLGTLKNVNQNVGHDDLLSTFYGYIYVSLVLIDLESSYFIS